MPDPILNATAPAAQAPDLMDAYEFAERRLLAAYCDCHGFELDTHIPQRNLDFCCPVTVSLTEAICLLRRYVPGYNDFDPVLLTALPPRCRVRLAREDGVCLYVETRAPLDVNTLRQRMRCDVFAFLQHIGQTRTYRLYWD